MHRLAKENGKLMLYDIATGVAVGYHKRRTVIASIAFSLDGIEIIANGSGSHHKLRKLNTRIDLCRSATVRLPLAPASFPRARTPSTRSPHSRAKHAPF